VTTIPRKQEAGIETLSSVVIAEFDRDGQFIHGNVGLHRIAASNVVSIWQLISQPHPDTLINAVPDSDGRVHCGLITVRGPGESMVSLTGSIYHDADRILLVAGYDMNEFEAQTQSWLSLNSQVNVAYRELGRINRRLEIREQEIRQLSLTDALTGTGNRRRLDQALLVEAERSARYHEPLSLTILDIDHFKHVNDTYGHETGDRILQETGTVLLQMGRQSDIATRMGGEEFVVLLPATNLEMAVVCAERFRVALETRDFGLPTRVTSSFGVACLQPGESGSSLLARADKALYTAKQTGRNRVAAASAETCPEPG
jgi:two-component system cell cycle response regulator